jgi:hypothetical protein
MAFADKVVGQAFQRFTQKADIRSASALNLKVHFGFQ